MQTKTKLLWKHIRAFFKRNANEMLGKRQINTVYKNISILG